jgi:CubicO group peptidase (beta-lactamase class C family)
MLRLCATAALLAVGANCLGAERIGGAPENNLDVPSEQGIMVGFPPAPENLVTPQNQGTPRFARWSVMHSASNFPTARVSRGTDSISPLPQGRSFDLERVQTRDDNGNPISMREFYQRTGLDAILVLYRGRIVFERYLGDMQPTTLHGMFSCTKSLVGTLAVMLAHEGKLDLSAPAERYVPELATSALGSAALQQLLDMRANFRLGDDMHKGASVQRIFHQALGVLPRPKDYNGPDGAYALLMSAKPAGEHGTGPFRYDNASTQALGWVMQRATGKSMSQLFSERFWTPLGAQQDADMVLDVKKAEWTAAGMSANLRDLARFGEMMRLNGVFNGKRIVPREIVADIREGGDKAALAASPFGRSRPGGSYHSQWWINHDAYDSYNCAGHFGQRVWIAPKGETVIVQFSTDMRDGTELEPLRQRTYRTIVEALKAEGARPATR